MKVAYHVGSDSYSEVDFSAPNCLEIEPRTFIALANGGTDGVLRIWCASLPSDCVAEAITAFDNAVRAHFARRSTIPQSRGRPPVNFTVDAKGNLDWMT